MADRNDPSEPGLFFQNPDQWLGMLDAGAAAALAAAAGDVALVVDDGGVIRDVAAGGADPLAVAHWIGQPWSATVAQDSRDKVDEMLSRSPVRAARWHQVNHSADPIDVPIRYKAFRIAGGRTLAIGRDERAAGRLQQRLLQVQQSLERDYLKLRQAESRYRLLFDMTAEPMLIVETSALRIRELNPAAARLMGGGGTGLAGQPLVAQIAAEQRDQLIAFLGAAATGAAVAPIDVRLAKGAQAVTLTARSFRQEGANFYLLQLGQASDPLLRYDDRLALDLVERMPDGFVLADRDLAVVSANAAFLELLHMPGLDPLRGRPLENWLGRPGIDLDLILAQLDEHGVARNVATIVRGVDGGQDEVEVSAVRAGVDEVHYGFIVRAVARRLRDLPPSERDLPRSVEQLTELVGRMPLKDIVRESTDLIERLCIEAALAYTSNNRASAAEILGLSRQSLYSKLHRHGLSRSEGDAAE